MELITVGCCHAWTSQADQTWIFDLTAMPLVITANTTFLQHTDMPSSISETASWTNQHFMLSRTVGSEEEEKDKKAKSSSDRQSATKLAQLEHRFQYKLHSHRHSLAVLRQYIPIQNPIRIVQ